METIEKENSELADIKKLMVIGLIRSGLSQSQIASALGVHRTSLSRMFPKGTLSEIAKASKLKVEESNNG